MSNVLAVFGATGTQGGSVIEYVLNDAELSKRYKIRAITRDVDSEQAKQLKQKVEVVQGDAFDRNSLNMALTGANTIFAMTAPSFEPNGFEIEYNSAKTIADAAVEQGVEYIIFSTLPSARDISGGKYTRVTPYDAKAEAARYIQTLPIKTALYCPGAFMQNFQRQAFLAPRPDPDGTWVLSRPNSPKTKMPLIDAVGDSGKFVGAILADPDKYVGRTMYAATGLYSFEEIVAIMSKTTGKTIVHKQVSADEFRQSLSSVGEILAEIFVEGYSYYEDFGYFGPDPEEKIAQGLENARGRPSTFEEYSAANPLRLV